MTWTRSLPVLLLMAIALSVLAATTDRLPGDLWLTQRAQELPGWFEPLTKAARVATSTEVVVVLGLAMGAALLIAQGPRLAVACFVAFATLPFLQAGIKNVVGRPRPDGALVEHRAGFTSESFPSGHTMSGTLLSVFVVTVALSGSRDLGWFRWAVIGGAAAVLAASMLGDLYLGVHWASDVAGGLLWAGALFAAAMVATHFVMRRRSREG